MPLLGHAPSPQFGEFYGGMLHPLTAAEHALAIGAIGLWAAQHESRLRVVALVFPLAMGLGGLFGLILNPDEWPFLPRFNSVSIGLLGVLVAGSRREIGPLGAGLLAGIFGCTHGWANAEAFADELRPVLFIPGMMLSSLICILWVKLLAEMLEAKFVSWAPIAIRALGSWLAAVGFMILGFQWKN